MNNQESLIVINAQLKENSRWFLFLGIGMAVLGIFAIIYSTFSTLFSVAQLGILLIVIGIFEAIKAFKLSKFGTFFLHLCLAILYVLAGLFIVSNPLVNALSLTLLLAAFLVGSGVAKLIFSFSPNIIHKSWMALNGILSILIGILIWQQWPESGLWAIGTLVGCDVLSTGIAWIMFALKAKDLVTNRFE